MLSILIPVYNYDITKLVSDLHQQALDTLVDFEIIVMEDGSTLYLDANRRVADLKFCRYIPSEENIGRSAGRNKLAELAKYGHLIFIDCDAEVCSANFVNKYLSFVHEECVVVGGTAYDPNEKNPDYSLRLKYGREREARSAKDREKQKYQSFTTFNFLIAKSLFEKIRFDESIRSYGYEDTVFGHQLVENGYEVLHIENPLIHKGLDTNDVYMQKTEGGLKNLYLLYKTGRYPFLANESKLLHTFVLIKRMGLNAVFALFFRMNRKTLKKSLCEPSPSLRVYDLYKLLFLCYISRQK
ncbi:glycosyltransferase family 2 protein [Paludibacter sp. 221]|uniref:glycosyltransferase family 2 protein n=1 Tax=Paludibacter sp. 221 TaxID=2302939 RepID=UPI0013D695F5|nr:glycosyltransferase [Paludibacter sp. 221]NDV47347.1 glycosyltransferase family 2 protein [Paludibacter sp. 221]